MGSRQRARSRAITGIIDLACRTAHCDLQPVGACPPQRGTMPGIMRRWIVRILISLVLGAITTVAVAWACAAFIDTSVVEQRVGLTDLRGPQWLFGIRSRRGAALAFMRPRWIELHEEAGALLPGAAPRWSEASAPPNPRDRFTRYSDSNFIRHEGAGGWPLLSLVWTTDSNDVAWNGGPGDNPVDWGIELPRDLNRQPIYVQRRALPLRPIWPGFLIDTLFYAAIWFAIFFGFTGAKRFSRIRRGRCPRCGYDLRGQRQAVSGQRSEVNPPHPSPLPEGEGVRAGCPECGWGRET